MIKNRRKIYNYIIISLSVLLVIAMAVMLSFIISGIGGKDGQNGKNASVIVSEDGELIVNDEETGIFANRADCELSILVDGAEYGNVVGGGKFAKGQTMAVQAVPNAGACFKGWRNQNGEIVSTEKTYSFVVEDDKIELTAVFEKSYIEVYFKTAKNNEQFFGNNLILEMNGQVRELKTETGKYGTEFFVLKVPATFEYGETVSLNFLNFKEPDYQYNAYLSVVSESVYNGEASGGTRVNITENLSYQFKIDKNQKYFFVFDVEMSIFIEIIPTINIASNNTTYGDVSKTECRAKGDEVTLTATPKDSGTTDYIYTFEGWYDGEQLITSNKTYTFTAVDYSYTYTAKFVKKYALKFNISTYEKTVLDENMDANAYKVTFKKITINAINSKGEISTVIFGGNYGGATMDTSTKICGYFEVDEMIYLSADIESAHESYYIIDDNVKEFKEKFVYTKWYIGDKKDMNTFADSSSAVYMIRESTDMKNTINVELFVVHFGDKIGG